MHILEAKVRRVLEPDGRAPLTLAREPFRIERLVFQLEVGDHPPEAAEPVADEEGDEHERDDAHEARVELEHLLDVLERLGELGQARELSQLEQTQQAQQAVEPRERLGVRCFDVVRVAPIRVLRIDCDEHQVERDGADDVLKERTSEIAHENLPVVVKEVALSHVAGAEVDRDVADEP